MIVRISCGEIAIILDDVPPNIIIYVVFNLAVFSQEEKLVMHQLLIKYENCIS